MTIEFIPFEVRHLLEIHPAEMRVELAPFVSRADHAQAMEIPGRSGTCIEGTRIIGCAGLMPQWPGREIAWAVFGDVAKRAWPELTHRVRAGLDGSQANGTRRIETAVLHGFSAAHRWAWKLGFRPEGPMEKYAPNGDTYWLYARIR